MALCSNKSNANQFRFSYTNSTKKSVWKRVGGGYENVTKRSRRDSEKEFITKVNGMSWVNFVESKRYIHLSKNVMEWDDKEAKEAFFAAKARFWPGKTGVGCGYDVPDLNPDLHIDNVDWNSREQVEDDLNDAFLSIEEEEAADGRCEVEEVVNGSKYLSIPVLWYPSDQIKATGWEDDDCLEPQTLEGMIVGGP